MGHEHIRRDCQISSLLLGSGTDRDRRPRSRQSLRNLAKSTRKVRKPATQSTNKRQRNFLISDGLKIDFFQAAAGAATAWSRRGKEKSKPDVLSASIL